MCTRNPKRQETPLPLNREVPVLEGASGLLDGSSRCVHSPLVCWGMSALISFRFLDYSDIPLFMQWVSRPHVVAWWDPPPINEVEAWCAHPTEDSRSDLHYIAVQKDLGPIGFIQTYFAVEGHQDGWWLNEHDPGVRGIDQFLADADQLGRGLGTALIRAFVAMQFEDPSVTRIQCDPALLMYCDRN